MTPLVLIIQHANCNDGAVAGVVARRHYANQGLSLVNLEAHYSAEIFRDMANHDLTHVTHLVIVDYSFKLPDFQSLLESLPSLQHVIWLDHHAEDMNRQYQPLCKARGVHYEGVYDRDRSGASIAWDYFNPNETRPLIIGLVEDRDLWRNRITKSFAFAKGLTALGHDSLERDMVIWDMLDGDSQEVLLKINSLVAGGETILNMAKTIAAKYHGEGSEVESTLIMVSHRQDQMILVVSESREMFSDVANMILDKRPGLAVVMNVLRRGGLYHLEFRSRKGEFDVADLAKQFGGGGHQSASGARFHIGSPAHKVLLSLIDGV